jgi:hypothetical protein
VRYLFWQLVPPQAIADVGPQPPLHGLGHCLGDLGQLRRLLQRVELRLRRHEARVFRQQRRQLLQVAGAGAPPAPVRPQHLAEPLGVDHVVAVRLRADRHPGEQVGDVVRVLGVQLEDLELGQQQVGRVEREAGIAERRPEIERVAHHQPVHHDVDRASRGSGEIHLPVAVQVVEHAVGDAPAAFQVSGDLAASLSRARQVHVLAGPQPGREFRAERAHSEPAEQPQFQARLCRALDERNRLGQRVVIGCGHATIMRK